MDVGQPERRPPNYIRHGTLDLFAALNVATGEVLARCTRQHRAQDFVAFLRDIDASVEPDLDVHVVLDNLSAHKAPPVHRWLLRHPRVRFHFTPTYASWLNLVERFFGLLTEKALRRGSHTSIPQLREAILPTSPRTTRKTNRSPGPKPPTTSSIRCGALASARSRYTDHETFAKNHGSRGLGPTISWVVRKEVLAVRRADCARPMLGRAAKGEPRSRDRRPNPLPE
jgi:transposase